MGLFKFLTKSVLTLLVFCLVGTATQTLARVERGKAKHLALPPPSAAKIFLIAGSSQNANFAQEVIDQKNMWLREGFREHEIACYYIAPDGRDFQNDASQWNALSRELEACYPASVRILREHLSLAASRQSDFVYLFITSHGQRPLSMRLQQPGIEEERSQDLRKLAKYKVMDEYILTIEGLPKGRANLSDMIDTLESGASPQDLFLTPEYLQRFLARYFPETPKFIVLQGCYSGGFLKDPRKEHKQESLRELDQITVLTAARYDRTSFGCHPGDEVTFFGGAFNEQLADFIAHPLEMKWKKLYQAVERKVEAMEEVAEGIRPSEPLYFSNYKRKKD